MEASDSHSDNGALLERAMTMFNWRSCHYRLQSPVSRNNLEQSAHFHVSMASLRAVYCSWGTRTPPVWVSVCLCVSRWVVGPHSCERECYLSHVFDEQIVSRVQEISHTDSFIHRFDSSFQIHILSCFFFPVSVSEGGFIFVSPVKQKSPLQSWAHCTVWLFKANTGVNLHNVVFFQCFWISNCRRVPK